MQQDLLPDWLLLTAGLAVGLIGLAVLLWSLFADRARGRRRCPRCSYSMIGLASLTCPECGHTARSEHRLFTTRRRWRWVAVASLLVFTGVAPLAHMQMRKLPGQWWNALPTAALLPLIERDGPQSAIWHRLDDGNPETGWASPEALSRRNWERLAEAARQVMLDTSRPRQASSWFMFTLARIIPHDDIVDPILLELLLHADCPVRESALGAAYAYYLERQYLSGELVDAMVTIACDPGCAAEARFAANLLARTSPLPVKQLHQIIACITADPALAGVWNGLQSGLSAGGDNAAPLEDRLAFIATLDSSDNPAIREQAALLRAAVETAPRRPSTSR